MNYYNEHDKNAASWLRELIKADLIPQGDVDERDIREIKPSDLDGYTQHHFFAGIGGWSYALRLAGWPDDRPVWTGSCPCQPFSSAGKRKGTADDRHLWPAFRWLIAQCRPAVIFGEQVASKLGRTWVSGVRADLEALGGYAVGIADLCGASVGAPQIRQRIWWVGHSSGDGGLEESSSPRVRDFRLSVTNKERRDVDTGPESIRCGFGEKLPNRSQSGNPNDNGLANPNEPGPQGRVSQNEREHASQRSSGESGSPHVSGMAQRKSYSSAWSDSLLIECRDGKVRRIPSEPSLFPLATRIPTRVPILRGSGNSIIPQVAQAFVESYLDLDNIIVPQ